MQAQFEASGDGGFTAGFGLDAYEPGILLNGRFSDRVGLRMTLTNGEGIGAKDVNSAKSASGRLTLRIGSNKWIHANGVSGICRFHRRCGSRPSNLCCA